MRVLEIVLIGLLVANAGLLAALVVPELKRWWRDQW